MARVIKWSLLILLLALIAATAVAPQFAKRAAVAVFYGSDDAPLWFYNPRIKVPGAPSAGPPHESPEDQQINPAVLQAAADYAQAHGSRALIVSRRSHLVLEKTWERTGGRAVDNSGTLSQTIAALMTGIALGEAKIGSLDEPAANYIKEWQADARRAIRIRDLLQMTSGFEPARFGERITRLSANILDRDMARRLASTPGEYRVRQNIDPQMLALVIERATGRPYRLYVSEMLWKRLGASDAYLWLDADDGTPHADCCMLARPGDWMRVAEVLANDGVYLGEEIVRPGWIKQMLTPAHCNRHYGLHMGPPEPADEPLAAHDMCFIDGGRYRLWISPSLHLAILRIGDGADRSDWSNSHIPNLIVGGLRDVAPAAAQPAKPIDPSLYAPH
jgi:CubicO group peptidase (beta-lactamase class C family)